MSARHDELLRVLAGAAGMTVEEFEARALADRRDTQNGREVAAAIFTRAGRYWPDFFDLDDHGPLAVWAEYLEQHHPFVTPEMAERAIDAMHAARLPHPDLADVSRALQTTGKDGAQ